ncbi:enoyl-CoA hydratase/isomerase family protein [Corallincola platygyrae]|uniref:3-hydroxyisobutyryl-CoA hydrolase n=1 Tax=Corallincola platygyrae TaxID=1193278 RepID=A0ABW4XIS8_9GAMM
MSSPVEQAIDPLSEVNWQLLADDLKSALMPLANGKQLGVLRLHAPSKLNALSLTMVKGIGEQLTAWADDDSVVAVWLDGEGEKAFCAGGDIVDMYHAMKARPNQIQNEVRDFFTLEYTTDHQIHTYSKPIVVWGDGIVMGGGIGLLAGASHRLVTERSRLAMPEISIGLYPDVAGTWFLPKMPNKAGLFLGLTGAQINGSDAVYLGMADHRIGSENMHALMHCLSELPWQGDASDFGMLSASLDKLTLPSQAPDLSLPMGYLAHQQQVSQLCQGDSLADVVEDILKTPCDEDEVWLSRAKANLKAGSPVTAHIVWQVMQQPPHSLADAFRQELGLSCRCAESGEFAEGVRALLVDKDRDPKWLYPDINAVPPSVIEHYFDSPWAEQQHPLRDLA